MKTSTFILLVILTVSTGCDKYWCLTDSHKTQRTTTNVVDPKANPLIPAPAALVLASLGVGLPVVSMATTADGMRRRCWNACEPWPFRSPRLIV